MRETIIIAEIGENHIGDMEIAKKMIKEAANAGADIVKFQSYLSDEVKDTDPEKEWFSKVQLSNNMHFELKEIAEKNKIEFLSSPFSLNRAKFLCEDLGLKKIKIASSEMLNIPLLKYINKHAEVVFLSTGLSTINEIKKSVSNLNDVEDLYLLHCITQYPTKPEDANLLAIKTLEKNFPKYKIGYSDHTLGILAALVSVALGAKVVEKHFTIDKNLPGTDHILSADPNELNELVKKIGEIETLLGTGEKKPTKDEEKIISFVRSRFPK